MCPKSWRWTINSYRTDGGVSGPTTGNEMNGRRIRAARNFESHRLPGVVPGQWQLDVIWSRCLGISRVSFSLPSPLARFGGWNKFFVFPPPDAMDKYLPRMVGKFPWTFQSRVHYCCQYIYIIIGFNVKIVFVFIFITRIWFDPNSQNLSRVYVPITIWNG